MNTKKINRSKIIDRSKFIELLSNFIFTIYFHDEKYPRGKLIWNEEIGNWGFDESKDYWNFFININSYHIDYVIENWKENSYGEFLENYLNDYIKQNDTSNLLLMSIPDCFDLLNIEIEKLNRINNQFHTKKIIDEAKSGTSYEVQWHDKIYIQHIDQDKGCIAHDRFINEQFSFFVSKQKDVIEFAISFLNKKIQWLELRQKKEDNTDIVKSLENYFDETSKFYSNISTTSKIKYFSYDVNKSKLNDENSDYIRGVLLDNEVIEDVDYRDFRRLFNNEILTRPIVWIVEESVLHYFIKTLVERGVIYDHNNVWKITSTCFVIKGKDITRRIDHKRIARLKRPNKGIYYKKFDKVFNFIEP